ncbi:hypothetical protein M0R45_019887 [Rubus argutus]|uniref:Uncharacterized protein n=1 Tax=Rubus argutus TaxID=59490 RepID=A0AAW1X7N1_RUBAR
MAAMLPAHLLPSSTSSLSFFAIFVFGFVLMARSSHFGVAAIDPFLIRAMVVGGDLWNVGPLGWRISFLGSYCLLKRGFASGGDGGIQSSCFAAAAGLDLADGGVLMGLPWIRRRGATSLVVQSNIGTDGYSPRFPIAVKVTCCGRLMRWLGKAVMWLKFGFLTSATVAALSLQVLQLGFPLAGLGFYFPIGVLA